VADLAKAELVEAMTGGEGAPAGPGATPRESARSSAPPVLSVRGLSGAAFADVSFDVRVGEVIGIAGSNASGKHQLAETLYGLRAPSAGEVTVSGSAVAPGDVVAALRRGIALVPRDRHDQGVVPGMSIADNAAMTVLDRLGPAGIVRRGKLLGMGTRAIAEYDMVAAGADVPVAELSGGNQQKVVLARALASDPGVLVLINPTAGVDVRSKEALLAVVERVRERGTAVLIVSDELDDLRSCDRVLVLRSGHLTAEHPAGWPDAELVASIEGVDLDGE
jgi:simple sugar transport system ATP-binding protein